MADDYVGLKDNFQAKATLQSIIDNYKGNDDILSTARQKLDKINGIVETAPIAAPDSTQTVKPDSTQVKNPAGNGN